MDDYRDIHSQRFQQGGGRQDQQHAQPPGPSTYDTIRGMFSCCSCGTWSTATAVAIPVTILLLLLFFLSFSIQPVSPVGYGLLYNRISNNVDSNTIYRGGIHFVWPYFQVVIPFPATLKTIEFSEFDMVPGATKVSPLKTRSAEGLALTLHIAFQYKLLRDELPSLYRVANLQYEKLFISNARDTLLKAASEFKANEYWSKRFEIGAEMHKRVNMRIAKLHGTVVHLEVLRIDLPRDWEAKIVATQVAQQRIETEKMKQQATTIRANTKVISSECDRKVTVIIADGHANGTYLVQAAEATAAQNFLNVEAETLTYAREILDIKNASKLVEFQLGLALHKLQAASFLVGVPSTAVIAPMHSVEPSVSLPPSLAPPLSSFDSYGMPLDQNKVFSAMHSDYESMPDPSPRQSHAAVYQHLPAHF